MTSKRWIGFGFSLIVFAFIFLVSGFSVPIFFVLAVAHLLGGNYFLAVLFACGFIGSIAALDYSWERVKFYWKREADPDNTDPTGPS